MRSAASPSTTRYTGPRGSLIPHTVHLRSIRQIRVRNLARTEDHEQLLFRDAADRI